MVLNAQIKNKSTQFYFDALPKATARAFKKCSQIDFLGSDEWYLAGGTALALQTGHRRSVDLDFFTKRNTFDENKIEKYLNNYGKWTTTSISKGTLYGEFIGAKISFISYPFFAPAEPMIKYGSISLLAQSDIAVMKMIAISQRGRKRDFFDLYWICQNLSLYEIFLKIHSQYSIHQNLAHILKSLVYFEDAESDPDPEIYFDANWRKVKSFFRKEIPIIADKIMR